MSTRWLVAGVIVGRWAAPHQTTGTPGAAPGAELSTIAEIRRHFEPARTDNRGVRTRIAIALALACLLVAGTPPPAIADEGALRLQRPIPGELVRVFEQGPSPWSPGHRGVDLAGTPGESVRAAAAGRVSFVGWVAGRPVISIEHAPNGLRTTYEPVQARVQVGQVIAAGDVIGALAAGHPCPASACLHWGLRTADEYFNPMAYLDELHVRLLPSWATPRPAPQLRVGDVGAAGTWPAEGRITSRFGMRLHPVLGVWRLHDGTDIAAPCGAPVHAMWPGRVRAAASQVGWGNRIIIDHGLIGGRHLVSGYAHLSAMQAHPGQTVSARQRVGSVGSTGYSTGCHVHVQVWVDGRITDPEAVVR